MSERLDDRSNLDKLQELQSQLETTERELAQRDALLAAIVEGATEAIIARDLDSRVIAWNHAAERMYGYSSEEMIGTPIYKIIPPEYREEHVQWMNDIQAGKNVGPVRTKRLAKDGREVSIIITVSPVIARNGEILGASAIEHEDVEIYG